MNEMMVVLPRKVTADEVQRLVLGLGGRWLPDARGGRGILSQGEAAIYIDVGASLFVNEDEGYLKSLEKTLGFAVRDGLSVQVGHADGSAALAARFGEIAVSQLGGKVLWDY